MALSKSGLVPSRPSASWLVCPETHDRLTALEPLLTQAATRAAPATALGRPPVWVGGGKRLRAALVLLAGTFGERPAELLRAALIPELLHTGSLIQDDVIDGAHLRRGAPALHRQVGIRRASLFANHLYCAAFALVCGLSEDTRHRSVRAALALCRGQALELSTAHPARSSAPHYRRVVAGKTAALFAVAAWLGARVSGAPPHLVRALQGFGLRFGMLYQIVDDLLDLFGDPEKIGKPTGGDLERGILTLPWVYWLEERSDHRLAARLREGAPLSAAESWAISSDLRESSAVARVVAEAEGWSRGAARRLVELPESPARRSLECLLQSVAERPRRLVAGTRSTRRPLDVVPEPVPDDAAPVAAEAARGPARVWSSFEAGLSRELPWYAGRARRVRRRVERSLRAGGRLLVERFDDERRQATVAEGLTAAVPILFGSDRGTAIEASASLELLLAAARCQRGLIDGRFPQSPRILAGDFLLCGFMVLMSGRPPDVAARLAQAASDYTATLVSVAATDPRAAAARTRLALAEWATVRGAGVQSGLEAFAREKIAHLLGAAERLQRPGIWGDPATSDLWTRALEGDVTRLAAVLRGLEPARSPARRDCK